MILKMEEIINNFNSLNVHDITNERNILMIKMRCIDDAYGGMFEELYSILEEFLLYDGDKIFNSLNLKGIIYDMIDYISITYTDYINTFISFMKENVSNNMRLSDILYCIQNY
jgi:hypothetical protein